MDYGTLGTDLKKVYTHFFLYSTLTASFPDEICICIALKDCVLEPIIFIFLFTANLSLVLLIYLYSTVFTELSAAPQTTLGRGPGSRFEPGTGGSTVVAGTLTT